MQSYGYFIIHTNFLATFLREKHNIHKTETLVCVLIAVVCLRMVHPISEQSEISKQMIVLEYLLKVLCYLHCGLPIYTLSFRYSKFKCHPMNVRIKRNGYFLPFASLLQARMHICLTIDHAQKNNRYTSLLFNPTLCHAFSTCFDTHDISEGISYSCMGLHLDKVLSSSMLIA